MTRRVPTGRAAAFSSAEDSIGKDDEAARTIAAWRDRLARGEAVEFDSEIAARPAIASRLAAALATLRRLDPAFAARRAPAASALAGTTLGPFRIERRLGAGGMGEVFLATLVRGAAGLATGERVALKLVHAHLLERAGFVERFEREARLGLAIRHENVVRTLDATVLDAGGAPRHALAMEFVEGETLREMLDDLERLPEGLCRHVGLEVARGLAAIHAAGAVHRDLKPENVIVTRAHAVKLMDLGVARLAAEAARLSATGVFAGSIHYAAPEQLRKRGSHVDARADLFALGVVLYELATGTHPFPGDDLPAVLRKLVEDTPGKVAALNPQLSPFFEEVVATLLAKDPAARFASADELARVLDEGEASAWWQARAQAIRATTRRPLRRIRIPRETALYGREAEMALLRSLFERASAGEGQVALVQGEAGIGKSRLVSDFVDLLHQQGHDVSFLYGSYPPGGAATASGAFSTAYREHFGDDEAAIRAALTATPLLVPSFAALLRGDAAPKGAELLTKDSLQTVFVHATRAFAAERTTIVLIDDLHFAPEEGRALFASLALAVPGHRVLLVGCARPSLDERWAAQISANASVTRLAVQRLGPKELVHLLRDALKSERLAEELSALIAVKSDGNPFFVFELLRGLRDGQFLRQRPDGTWETTQIIRDIQVPSSISELVQGRVADLADDDKNLLDAASCCGFEFDPLIVAEALGRNRITTLQTLGRIEKRHRLVRSAGRRFVFDHHQVQEALYAGLSEPLREEYHAFLGAAIEARIGAAGRKPEELDGAVCVEISDHFLRGAHGERAVGYLDAALTHLESHSIDDSAVRLAGRALDVPGLLTGKRRIDVLLRGVVRLDLLGRREAEKALLAEAMTCAEATGEPALRARTLTALGRHLLFVFRLDEARSTLEAALALARSAGERRLESNATGILGNVLYSLGRHPEAKERFEQSLALARELGEARLEASATGNLGNVFNSLGRLAEAREQFERHLALSHRIGDRRGVAMATGNLGVVHYAQSQFAEAQALYERYLVLAREIGDRSGEAIAIGNLGNVLDSLGHPARARELYERHLALAREIGDRRGEAMATGNLALALAGLGLCAEAREHHVRHLALTREIRYRDGETLALINLGAFDARLGQFESGRARLEEGLLLSRDLGLRELEGLALASCAEAAAAEGDEQEAVRLLEASIALQRELGREAGIAEMLIEIADLRRRQGDAAGASAAVDEAWPLVRTLHVPAMTALCLALRASVSGEDVQAARDALVCAGDGAEWVRSHFLVWQATGDRKHLAEAKRLLDHLVEHAPPECREPMLANVRLHREIADAAREHRAG